jgi:hypothetical protein
VAAPLAAQNVVEEAAPVVEESAPDAANASPAPGLTIGLPPYPALDIFNAFREGCGTLANQAAASASLTANGWQAITTEEATGLQDFLEFAREAGGEAVAQQGGTMSAMEVFTKTVSFEKVYIVLSEVRVDGVRVSGCRLFDLGETRAISPEMVTYQLGEEPIRSIDRPEITVHDWEPGLMPDHDSFQLFFIPPKSPVKDILKFDGVVLKSDTVGAED